MIAISCLPFRVFVPASILALVRRCLAVIHRVAVHRQCVAHPPVHYHVSAAGSSPDAAAPTPKCVRLHSSGPSDRQPSYHDDVVAATTSKETAIKTTKFTKFQYLRCGNKFRFFSRFENMNIILPFVGTLNATKKTRYKLFSWANVDPNSIRNRLKCNQNQDLWTNWHTASIFHWQHNNLSY